MTVVIAPSVPGSLPRIGCKRATAASTMPSSGAVSSLIRRGLDRSRYRSWERELHLLAYNDDGWANRNT